MLEEILIFLKFLKNFRCKFFQDEASGSSHDFAKGILNIPFSFLVELRPQNTLHSTGFLLPEAEIADTADETWEAIKVVADKVLERFAPFIDGRKTWKGRGGFEAFVD